MLGFFTRGGSLCWKWFGSQEMVQNQPRRCNITSTIAESCIDVGAALVAKQREHSLEEKSRCDPCVSFRVSFDAGNVASAFVIVASEESSQYL